MATPTIPTPVPSSTAIPAMLAGPGPGPKQPLKLPTDVAAQMKAHGYDPVSFEKELSDLQTNGKEDEAVRTYGLVIDRNRRGKNSNAFGELGRAVTETSGYQQQRVAAGSNNSLSAWDDFGRSFMNGAVVRLGQGMHMLGTAIPAAMDSKNPDWMRTWQDANAQWYQDNKLFVSPAAEAGMFDEKGDLSWKGFAGTMGNTLGMMAATFIPAIGAAGRVGNAVAGAGMLARTGAALTSTAAQSGYIGFMQMLPMYTEEARKAGYTPAQSMMAAIPLAVVQGTLEHFGMDQFTKGMGLSANQAAGAMRMLRQETAKEAFSLLAGKPLTVDAFKDVTEQIGKGFLSRLRQPETLKAIAAKAKLGAVVEGGEEFLQSTADAALKKMFDIAMGTGTMGDQTKDGKGFDPTVKEYAMDAAVGTLLGGVIGGSMGGMFAGMPSSIQQQTLFAKVDSDVRKLLENGGSFNSTPDDQRDAVRQEMSAYKLLNKARQNGQIDDQVFQQSLEKLDAMATVSEQLAKGVSNPTARYALFDLNGRQSAFEGKFEQEITQPLARLNELATPDQQSGAYRPKPGLPVLALAEANSLIAQNLPQRSDLGQQIKGKIDNYVTQLVDPDQRETALKKYAADLDTDMRQFDQKGQRQQTTFEERELPGLLATMELPDGKGTFAIRRTTDPNRPREVVQVNTRAQGARSQLEEDRDPVINRFQGYNLPSKGKPEVRFTAVDEQTQDQLMQAFDQNPDIVKGYSAWRQELDNQYADDPMGNLQQARSTVESEQQALDANPNATDWDRSEMQRKQEWVRGAYQQAAEDPAIPGYGTDDYVNENHADFLDEQGIDTAMLAGLPSEYREGLYNALKAGDMDAASRLTAAAVPLNDAINPQDDESRPSALLAAFEAETDRLNRRTLVDELTKALSGRQEISNAVGEYVSSGSAEPAVIQRLASQFAELSAYQQQLADAIGALSSEESGDQDSDATGSESGTPGESTDSGNVAGDPTADGAVDQSQNEEPNTVTLPKNYNPLARDPQSTAEAILHYFVGGGRIRMDDVRRYGDANWMKGPKGGNPLVSYVGKDTTKIQSLDNIARSVRLDENEDEQEIMQAIMDALQSFPVLSAKQQLIQMQQKPIEKRLGESVPERTPLEVLDPLFMAMDRAGIDNTRQEELVRTIEEQFVTADGLDWFGVYDLLDEAGFLADQQLKGFIVGEYLNQVATFVTLTDEELAFAETLTDADVSEILAGARLSDDVFSAIMEQYALTEEEVREFNNILGAETPNPVTDEPSPERPATDPAANGEAEIGNEEDQGSDPDIEETPAAVERSAAEVERIDAAVDQAVADVDKKVAGLERKIQTKRNQADKLRTDLAKRTKTADIPFAPKPLGNYPAPVNRPATFFGQLVTDSVSNKVSIQNDPVVNPGTIIQVTEDGKGFAIESGERLARVVTYRNYMLEPYFEPINPVANVAAVTRIITVEPAQLNPDGSIVKKNGVPQKGRIFYETAKQPYDKWRSEQVGGGQQADLTDGQVSGLEAENSVKRAISEIDAEIQALQSERENVAATRNKVADVARSNAEAQQDIFAAQPAPKPAEQPAPQPALTPDEIRREELLARKKQLAADLRRSMGSTLNAGVNPETLRIGLEYFAVSLELGVIKFKDFVREFMADTGVVVGESEFSSLKAVYNASLDQVPDDVFTQMDQPADLRAIKLADVVTAETAPVQPGGIGQTITQEANALKQNFATVTRLDENTFEMSGYYIPSLADSKIVAKVKMTNGVVKLSSVTRDGKPLTKDSLPYNAGNLGKFKERIAEEVERFINTYTNDQRTPSDLESNSARNGANDAVGEEGLQPDGGTAAGLSRQASQNPTGSGNRPGSDIGVSDNLAVVFGEPGDKLLPNDEGRPDIEDGAAGTDVGGGVIVSGNEGVQPERDTEDAVSNSPETVNAETTAEKIERQRAAESIPAVVADRANIDQTLPFLLEGQREDVHTAETRFAKPAGYGMLFTNGTGTGKTFLALGAIKRQVKMGKKNILIVVYNDPIMNEWTKSAPSLGLQINQLTGINDPGSGIRITTFANFSQNAALAKEPIDFVVVDEAQYLMQNAEGKDTANLRALRAITLHPESASIRTQLQNPDLVKERESLNKAVWVAKAAVNATKTTEQYRAALTTHEQLSKRLQEADKEFNRLWDENSELVKNSQLEKRPRALFLSATPFAYDKNVQWAHGYLFEYPNVVKTGRYNEPNAYQQFMITHFGYHMKTGRLNSPEGAVDSTLMEKQFNSFLRKEGSLSARLLDIEADYQRLFILTPNSIGTRIGEGLDFLREADKYKWNPLHEIAMKRFDGVARRRLLEAIKAKESIPLIQKWHALGKKVVVFFDYNVGGGTDPFDFSAVLEDPENDREITTYDDSNKPNGSIRLFQLIKEFQTARPDLQTLNLGQLLAPIDQLREAFPNAGLINGPNKKVRIQQAKDFNDDANPDNNVLLAQSDAAAGWSAHDMSGKHPRVVLNLGLPTTPTKSIQEEGRGYRQGQHPASNTMFAYMNTGTNWEQWAFADKVAKRAGTAENLAMGQMARGLKDAFIQAFEESEVYEPHAGEGFGGKQRDRSLVQQVDDFDRAMSAYFSIPKKNAQTRSSEGVDYFATPEPLGLKMVEWGFVKAGEDVLEPSAGHGAIARWFPETANITIVEQSFDLAARAKLHIDGRLINDSFESLNIQNKYDVIAMNPPYGTAGKVASEHLKKAATQHLRDGGRVLAIVPAGPAFGDKFDKWFYEKDAKGNSLHPNLHISARIMLPSVTFKRANTNVNTQLIVIDRIDNATELAKVGSTMNVDLSREMKTEEFFKVIRDMDLPERYTPVEVAPVVAAANPAAQALMSGRGGVLPMPSTTGAVATTTAPTAAKSNSILKPIIEGVHTRDGHAIFTVPLNKRLEMADYRSKDQLARQKHAGFYSSFKGNGATPGFIFKTRENAENFIKEVDAMGQPQAQYADGVGESVPLAQSLINSLQSFLPMGTFGNMNEDGGFDQEAFDKAAIAAGFANTPEAILNGFRYGNTVYMNPSVLNAQTAMHEMGHIWASVMRSINPEVLQNGLNLMAGTRYENKYLRNPAYAQRENESQKEYTERIREEALMDAIADKGIKMLTDAKLSGFRKYLSEFWQAIKSALRKAGINLDTKGRSMADMTLDEFTTAVAGQMIAGTPVTSQPVTDVDPNRIDAQITMPLSAGRPITNQQAEEIAKFRTQVESAAGRASLRALPLSQLMATLEAVYTPVVETVLREAPNSESANRLTKIRNIGPFKQQQGSYYDPATGYFNADLLEDVARYVKGNKYKFGNMTQALAKALVGGELTRDWHAAVGGSETYIDADGNYQKADEVAEDADLKGSLATVANHTGAWGYLTKLLNSKAAGAITLPETIAHWLSADAGSSLREILINTRRAWVARASEIAVSRQQQLDKLTDMFRGISQFDGKNPASQVKMSTFKGFVDGVAGDITLPVAAWMHMIATHRSQQASHKGKSSIAAILTPAGALQKTKVNSKGKNVAYGYDYKDPVTGLTTTYLLDSQTLDTVENMLNTDHKAAFDAAKDFFNFPPALAYLSGLYRAMTGKELVMYQNYFPTVAVGETSDPLTQMPSLLKNAKILQEREGLPMRVRGGDMLGELQGYARREEHYIGNVATLTNLQRWQQRHDATLGKAPDWMKKYLEELEIDLNDPTARARQQGDWTEVKVAGVDVGLRAMLRRFTTSVFSFSPALPLKQVMTMMQGVGLGIVENKYLAQATMNDLAPLFVEAYKLARQNDEETLFGGTLKETPFLQEMAQNPYIYTVLNRALGRNEAYIGSATMDDIKANPYSGGVAVARKALHTVSDYGLGAVRRSDRAVILSFWKAAQYQVQADIDAGKMLDAAGNPVTSMASDEAMKQVASLTEQLLYETNQMTSESDRTPLQRDKSLASTLIGLYSGQQQRLLNSFIQRYADWVHAAPGSTEKNEAFNKMAWVGFNNIVLNAALMAVISMMWRMAMKMITGDDRPEEWGKTMAWDTARGVLGSFPSIPTEAVIMLTTMTDNQQWSSGLVEYSPGEALGQVVNGLQESVRYLAEDDEAKKAKLLNQIVYNLADGGTKLTGLPNNLGRMIGKMAKAKNNKNEPVMTEQEWEEALTEASGN